jgi:hypothetical protein
MTREADDNDDEESNSRKRPICDRAAGVGHAVRFGASL